jgi:hypothetical protein
VYSECVQKAEIDEEGYIEAYSEVEAVLDTIAIECPYCMGEITSYIEKR